MKRSLTILVEKGMYTPIDVGYHLIAPPPRLTKN